MGEVVQFGKAPIDLTKLYRFTMDFYATDEGDWRGEIVNFRPDEMSPGDRLREFADALSQLEFKMRKQAETMSEGPHGAVVAIVTIHEDASVRIRIDTEKIKTEEQFDWLDDRFEDAKEAART